MGKVKNLLILILALANILLVLLLGWKLYTGEFIGRQMRSELISLLNGKGIAISSLPRETVRSPEYTAYRSLDAEGTAVSVILGECQRQNIGGGIYRYTGDSGTAQFRSGGRFEITLNDGGIYDDLANSCTTILTKAGFIGFSTEYTEEDLPGGGKLLTFGQNSDKNKIFNARAAFEFSEAGKLLSVHGQWNLVTPLSAGAQLCKSAGAVLLELAEKTESGLEVSGVELGYRIQTTAQDVSVLKPEWRVVHSGGVIYLDAFTGEEISAGE